MTAVDLKLPDLLELSKVYAPEYNMPELSDRVLVFDVMQDGWETPSAVLTSCGESDEAACLSPEHSDVKPPLKSDQEPLQDQQLRSEKETMRNDPALPPSESESEPEAGSASDEETEADSAESPSTEATSENANDDNTTSTAALTEDAGEPTLLRQHKVFVHSSWLAVQSKYFRSLFYSGMKESNCKEVHVKISESEEDTHLKLLEAIYKADILNTSSVDELLAVLELADKYDVKFVFKKCKYVLQTHATNLDVCKTIVYFVKEKHRIVDVEDLAGTLQITLAKCFSPLESHWQTEKFTSLSQPCVKYLLGSNELLTQCENTVFQALMHWMETNSVDPSSIESTSTLLDAVRFDLTTIDYLYNVIRVHPIATKLPYFQELLLKGISYHALPAALRQRLSHVTPVARRTFACPILYAWEIKSAELPASCGTDLKLTSEMFWCCGYQCRLTFQKENRAVVSNCYPGLIQVEMLGLTNHNYVPLTFSFQSSCPTQEGTIAASCQFSTSSSVYNARITLKNNNSRYFTIGESFTINVTVQVQ